MTQSEMQAVCDEAHRRGILEEPHTVDLQGEDRGMTSARIENDCLVLSFEKRGRAEAA